MITVNNKIYNFDGICFTDCDGAVCNSEKWFKSEQYKQIREKQKVLEKDLISRSIDKWSDNAPGLMERFRDAHVDPASIEIFNTILTKNNLAIVLSSTWRGLEFTKQAFLTCGIDRINERFLGCTPQLKYTGNRPGEESRGLEIVKWMQDNNYTGPYIIIDDSVDFQVDYNGIYLMDKLVKTELRDGLTKEFIDLPKRLFC